MNHGDRFLILPAINEYIYQWKPGTVLNDPKNHGDRFLIPIMTQSPGQVFDSSDNILGNRSF